jgi:hypothetical protein
VNTTPIGPPAALTVVFALAGFMMFTGNVRTVQIIGLFASGAVFGASPGKLIEAVRAERKE